MLIDYDENFDAEPGLATDVEASDDNMTFTYTIRDEFVWSDGEPLTAEDVAYTMNLYKSNHAYLPQNYLTLIDGDVRLVDETHIQFDTLGPTQPVHGRGALHVLLHPAQARLRGDRAGELPRRRRPMHAEELRERPERGQRPVHRSPSTRSAQFVRMERNPFWTGPEPAIDEIIYRIYKNDDALSQALQQGEIDFAYIDTPNIFNSLKGQENIDTRSAPSPRSPRSG